MSSQRQIEANRRNAQKSTGPASVPGKARSSMNALKTGIHAKSLVLPSENVAELEELIEECYRSLNPATPEARCFVDEFIYCEWNLRRLRAAETQSWRHQDETSFSGPQKYPLGYSATMHGSSFSKLQYRMDATRRARESALRSLKQLQADAAAAPGPTAPRGARTRRSAVPNPLAPNYFAPNWLRSSNPLRHPRGAPESWPRTAGHTASGASSVL